MGIEIENSQKSFLVYIYAIKTRINYNKQLSGTTKCRNKLESLREFTYSYNILVLRHQILKVLHT